MADLRDHKKFAEGRWRYDEFGYSLAFGGRISPGDIDAVIEKNGNFLFLEHKEYDETQPFFLPRGQEIMLRRLAALPHSTVLFIAGLTKTGDPQYLVRIHNNSQNDIHLDLRDISTLEERKKRLYDLFKRWRFKAENHTPGFVMNER